VIPSKSSRKSPEIPKCELPSSTVISENEMTEKLELSITPSEAGRQIDCNDEQP
jgi:hypothetical protein